MEIDVDALVLAWRNRKIEEDLEAQRQTEESRKRQDKRQRENADVMERDYRRRATAMAEKLAQESSPTRLHSWFNRDLWTVNEALVLLCGYDPEYALFDEFGNLLDEPGPGLANPPKFRRWAGMRRLDNIALYDPVTRDIFGETNVRRMYHNLLMDHQDLLKLWRSGVHTDGRYPPEYFIRWALRKRACIPWLEWAKREGYFPCDEGKPAMLDHMEGGASDKVVTAKSESSFINIIGALCDLYWKSTHPNEKYSQTAMLKALEAYEGYAGLSERNLKDKLPKATKAVGLE